MTPDQGYNNPAKKKNIRRLASFFAQAVAAGGDMTEAFDSYAQSIQLWISSQ